ncbi:MAG: hypothetical protein IPN76_30850 [Saprospiraceae bacterium]|nr:hypothetical protein [Saprospiraceae bacterium]
MGEPPYLGRRLGNAWLQATVTGAPGSTITNFAEVFTSAESDPDSTPGNGNIGEDDGDTEVVTVNAAIPPVVLTCPTNTTTTACQTQAAVNAAFATWLATASGTGGCNGVLTNNNTGAPAACGGATTVTFTYTSTCAPLVTTCQATFTVPTATQPVLTCPGNITAAACQTQAAITAQYNAWLVSPSGTGGCNSIITSDNPGAPSACGGSTTVTFTLTSDCHPPLTCQATFTVTAAPTVVLTCPINTTVDTCQTQAAVNAQFNAWLATASASGGCNGVLTNNNTGAPSACGGSTTVTFTYTSTCAPLTTTCQATFTVPAAPTVVLTCPTNTTAAACQTQAAVNSAFATWLATASASGGCNGVLTNNNTGAPSACGGSTTVTFTYTSTCAPTTTTCQATFTVAAAPTVVLTCPTSANEPTGFPQDTITNRFNRWLATASASGGCNGVLTNNNTGAPPATGGSTTVTFTYTSSCAPLTSTCQATFSVGSAGPPNDLCANATPIACGGSSSGSTTNATIDGPINDCGGGSVAADVWYSIVGTGGNITASLCSGTNYDSQIDIYTGSCGSLTCVGGNDDFCSPASEITWSTTLGTTYYIRVHGFAGSVGNFSLNVTCANPPVVLTCPTNTTVGACQTQAAVNAQFAAWLATASGTGGCGGVLTNNNTGAPAACGGSTTVTFTYTSTCAPLTTTCQATFTVAAPPPVSIICPIPTTVGSCQTQAAINAQYAAWLATFNGQGGCNLVGSDNGNFPPSNCGEAKTVTFTLTSTCAPLTTSCQSTFTVTAPPPVVLTCPTNTTVAACQTQAAVNAAFNTWLATATASGGCNGVLTNNNTGAPAACGGSTTVTFTYTSSCAPLTTTCQATFTVPAAPTVVLTCPINATEPACERQDSINNRFNRWLATASGTGGCNGVLTNNNTGAPSACGGSTTVTFTYTSSCAPLTTTCQATFTVGSSSAPVLTCPVPTTASACLTQAQMNTAYANWLASATVSGGCGGGTLTNNAPAAPLICNPNSNTITVTFTYAGATCQSAPVTCTSTFTVPAYPTFTVPANGSATVACPANAPQPTPPTVVDGCGKALTPVGPTVTNVPNPLTCEGTRTYAWTYTDCAGLVRTWSFTYTIERLPFTVPANGSATVACPANATQPTPPTVTSNCGEVLTPTGPVVTNVPNPLTCEGTRTYAWTYTDCEGNTATWSFVYTIERQPFTVPANGAATVACPDQTDVAPTPPVVTSNCGEVLTPVVTVGNKPFCEGTRTYSFTYTDCEGNTATWQFNYTIEYLPFNVPASETMTVNCAANATQPTPPTVLDNCGKPITPVGPAITSTDNSFGCEGSRTYTWTYKDCEGNTRTWSKTYIINYTNSLIVPLDETFEVSCLLYAQPPLPQTLFDNCGQQIAVSGPTVEGQDNGCSGFRKYTYIYTDCRGNSLPWSFTYFANDNEPPVGQCPDVDVTNLACIGDVPCPEDFDFGPRSGTAGRGRHLRRVQRRRPQGDAR